MAVELAYDGDPPFDSACGKRVRSLFSLTLANKLLVIALAIMLFGSGLRYFLLAEVLRDDIQSVVTGQQTALAGEVAKSVDERIAMRRQFLAELARTLPENIQDDRKALQAWLAERFRLNPLFSLGLIVANPEGTILAEYPPVPGRNGGRISDVPDFSKLLQQPMGQVRVGRPRRGKFSGRPVLPMAIVIPNAAGGVRAVLIGGIALDAPGFLDTVTEGRIGQTGSFLLISPVDRIFVAARDPKMVLASTPAPGVNLLHDRAMAGYRGSGITRNAFGVEELSSIASVPSTGWFVVARLPTEEAFAPIRHAQDVVLRNTLTVQVGVLLLIAFLIRRAFRPLSDAAALADQMSHGTMPLAPLPVVHQDEVGHLTQAFNRLLDRLQANQTQLEHLARHDELTGLPNRSTLFERLKQGLARAQRMHSRLALLYLDLDGFKPINDELGHDQGDDVLIGVAQRLSAIIRETDTLARMGGDEFVLLVTDIDRDIQAVAQTLAGKCIEALAEPFVLQGGSYQVGVSIGIVCSDGGQAPDALLQLADQAMYVAKKSGKGCFHMLKCPSSD